MQVHKLLQETPKPGHRQAGSLGMHGACYWLIRSLISRINRLMAEPKLVQSCLAQGWLLIRLSTSGFPRLGPHGSPPEPHGIEGGQGHHIPDRLLHPGARRLEQPQVETA
jgi:hypothetical protein